MLVMDDGFICKLSLLAPPLHLNERERVREWRSRSGRGGQAWAKSGRVTLVRADGGCHMVRVCASKRLSGMHAIFPPPNDFRALAEFQ